MKQTFYYGTLILAISGVISGCASMTPQQSGADKVNITSGPVSKHCKLKGQVAVTNSSRDMSTPYQHTQLLDEEYSQLRNQALQLGANTVLLSSSSGMTDKKHWAGKGQHSTQAAHAYSGNAYWCPASR